jgi:hypothetical protein
VSSRACDPVERALDLGVPGRATEPRFVELRSGRGNEEIRVDAVDVGFPELPGRQSVDDQVLETEDEHAVGSHLDDRCTLRLAEAGARELQKDLVLLVDPVPAAVLAGGVLTLGVGLLRS